MAEGPLITLEGITKVYRSGDHDLHALAGVTLHIGKGEYTAIMGTSGSGKSTLMNILGALDRPTAGTYLLDGEPVSSMSDRKLSGLRNRKIGFVFQSFNLLPRLTAQENVEVPLVYAGVRSAERHARARRALGEVGLGDRLSHRPSQLSGGQQQRVAIARALVTEPRLLLADEPTGALDTDTTNQILALLSDLHAKGLTIVVVTHEPDVALNASRTVLVRDGRIVDDGPSATVLARRVHPIAEVQA
ncbi:MAG: ABC transporter ATP-binding protein [Deltaproteobacteria bacterium]|nr:ABC transporter ATP-binding protein [Deltaproteobacteria bacterium]